MEVTLADVETDSMDQVTQSVLDLAQQLLAREAGEETTSSPAALRAVEKLRVYLTKFVGAVGFRALQARALALARAEVCWLDAVQVGTDGALVGFDEAAGCQQSDSAAHGGAILLGHLLRLLVIFIGEAVMLRMIEEVWPHPPADKVELGSEEVL